jgi:hypothetical protein
VRQTFIRKTRSLDQGGHAEYPALRAGRARSAVDSVGERSDLTTPYVSHNTEEVNPLLGPSGQWEMVELARVQRPTVGSHLSAHGIRLGRAVEKNGLPTRDWAQRALSFLFFFFLWFLFSNFWNSVSNSNLVCTIPRSQCGLGHLLILFSL